MSDGVISGGIPGIPVTLKRWGQVLFTSRPPV
jgi:hypothetical protein